MINHFCFAKFLEWYQNKNFKTFVNQIGNLTFVQRTPKSKPFLMCCASCCCCCCCFVVGGGGGGKFCFVGICYRTNVVWLQNSTVLISIYSKIYFEGSWKSTRNLPETPAWHTQHPHRPNGARRLLRPLHLRHQTGRSDVRRATAGGFR